jgi:hypothetical protein
MRLPIIWIALLALGIATPAFAGDLSLRLAEPPRERPLKLDISGSYEQSPVAIIFRDAAFGALLGAAAGGGVALATEDSKWGRDVALGAGIGFLLGAVVGGFEASTSGPRISVHADVDRQSPEGTSALGGPTVRLGYTRF